MTEDEKDELMRKAESRGWSLEFEDNDKERTGWWMPEDTNGDRQYVKFMNWEEVEQYFSAL